CWVSPGGVLATLIWLAVSAGFAVYAANFGSYNNTYGATAAPSLSPLPFPLSSSLFRCPCGPQTGPRPTPPWPWAARGRARLDPPRGPP
ncbi:YhjD/YihY/BrkB family envelope integrity protein, partial [Streptomyces europaeiscabiei]|uniref:YhjD/YihY/BrkB family envelope integrity protein n=1 Tax=Streptomyces europaeiscabiei TaxID=146819 RepID=UPI0029A665C7